MMVIARQNEIIRHIMIIMPRYNDSKLILEVLWVAGIAYIIVGVDVSPSAKCRKINLKCCKTDGHMGQHREGSSLFGGLGGA